MLRQKISCPPVGSRDTAFFMTSIFDDEEATFHVVLNHEEQYSIWPAQREIPLGWKTDGTTGTKAECLAHIEKVWTDMRPLSLRKKMEADEAARTSGN
jgi:MbtH protein